jgi:hypothetical protein
VNILVWFSSVSRRFVRKMGWKNEEREEWREEELEGGKNALQEAREELRRVMEAEERALADSNSNSKSNTVMDARTDAQDIPPSSLSLSSSTPSSSAPSSTSPFSPPPPSFHLSSSVLERVQSLEEDQEEMFTLMESLFSSQSNKISALFKAVDSSKAEAKSAIESLMERLGRLETIVDSQAQQGSKTIKGDDEASVVPEAPHKLKIIEGALLKVEQMQEGQAKGLEQLATALRESQEEGLRMLKKHDDAVVKKLKMLVGEMKNDLSLIKVNSKKKDAKKMRSAYN